MKLILELEPVQMDYIVNLIMTRPLGECLNLFTEIQRQIQQQQQMPKLNGSTDPAELKQ